MAGNNTTAFPSNSSAFPDGGGGGAFCGPTSWPEENIYLKVAKQVWLIGPPIIVTVGIIGNILTVLILFRQFRRWSSTAVYLFFLAISDSIQLLNSPIRNWILRGLEKHDVRVLSELGCRFSRFFTYGSVHFSSWILVGVTVERFISVFWPHRVREGCTPKTSTAVIITLLIVVTGLNSHFFWEHGVSDLPEYYGEGLCEVLRREYMDFWNDIWPWIDFAVAFGVPFIILVVCNSMIIYKLQKTQGKIRKMSIIESSGERAFAKDKRNVTITLVLLSVVFMICLTPVQIYLIIIPHIRKEAMELYCTDFDEFYRIWTMDQMVLPIVFVTSYINAGFNFFLYVLSGKKFRDEVKSLLMCKKSGRAGVFGSRTAFTESRRQLTTSTTHSRSDFRKSSTGVSLDNKGYNPDPNEINDSNTNIAKLRANDTEPINTVCVGTKFQRVSTNVPKVNNDTTPVELNGINLNL